MGPPLTAEVDLRLVWERSPHEWSFRGNLTVHDIENLGSLESVEILRNLPHLSLLFPFLVELEQLEFSGKFPNHRKDPTRWNVRCRTRNGVNYGVEMELDPTVSPWNLSLSVSPFQLPLDRVSWLFPEQLADLPQSATCEILELHSEGALGETETWNLSTRVRLLAEELDLPGFPEPLGNIKLIAEGSGTLRDIEGRAELTVERIPLVRNLAPIEKFRARDLVFSVSVPTRLFEISGPWSSAKAPGGPCEGILFFSTSNGYRITAANKKLQFEDLGILAEGSWESVLTVESDSLEGEPPLISLDLTGHDVVLGGIDLSRRALHVHLEGFPESFDSPAFEEIAVRWGQALRVKLSGCEMNETGMQVEQFVITGDLLALGEFVPGFTPNPRLGQWVHPTRWKIRGGLILRFQPDFSLETRDAVLATGKDQGGPFSFSYSRSSSTWTFVSPVLTLDLAEVVARLQLPNLKLSGEMTLAAEIRGVLPGRETAGWWQVKTAVIRTGITSPSGTYYASPERTGPKDERVFGWAGMTGEMRVDWSSASRKIETDFRFRDWIWYTRPPRFIRDYTPLLTTPGARLKMTVLHDEGDSYNLRHFEFSQGEESPITLSLTGKISRTGEKWLPNLKVRMEGEYAKPTPVFRGIQLGGSGTFTGTITGNRRGNWVLNGSVSCGGIYFEHVVGPVFLEGIEGELPINDVKLDEIVVPNRWKLRKHQWPKINLTQQNALEEAFARVGRKTNIRIARARVGRGSYERLKVLTEVADEKLPLYGLTGYTGEEGSPMWCVGFFFFRPAHGVGWRIRGLVKDVPFHVAVPGIKAMGFDLQVREVDFYTQKDLTTRHIETRYLLLGIPIGQLKKIPGIGEVLFGWTPELLGSTELIVQRVGDGPWKILNPLNPTDVRYLPRFFLQKLPQGTVNQMQRSGTEFFKGVGSAVRDIFTDSLN